MYSPMASGLPDPEFQAEFYQDVPTKRLFAWILDVVITLVLTLLFTALTFPISIFFIPFWFVAIGFAYRVATISRWSATIGMRLVAIDLRQSDGSRMDFPTAAFHTLLYSISLSFILPHLASVVYALNNPRAQMFHDIPLGIAALNKAARS